LLLPQASYLGGIEAFMCTVLQVTKIQNKV
jgi:hypothetical protein